MEDIEARVGNSSTDAESSHDGDMSAVPRLSDKPTTVDSASDQSRQKTGCVPRRLVATAEFTSRSLRFLLGPSTLQPIPDASPSLHLSFTLNATHRSYYPDRIVASFSRKFRIHCALIPFLLLWATAFVLLIRQQYYVASPPIITCDASVWPDWPPDTCGVDGTDCLADLGQSDGAYRCLGGCADVVLGNPRWIGGLEVTTVPLVIGGNSQTYRADSWICPAAIHAGLISRTLGGCVSLNSLPYPTGSSNFLSSVAHGISSFGFLPQYPGAVSLSAYSTTGCLDLHPIISTVNAVCLAVTVIFLRPSPGLLYYLVLFLAFAQVVLLSDPESTPPDWGYVFGAVPAVLFTGYWAWKVSFKRSLKGFRGLPVELAIWQGGGFWLGVESSTIFAKLPIQRLGYGSLTAAGVVTLVVIVVLAAVVVVIQAWSMRKYGLLRFYLVRYLPLVPILAILATLPNYVFRLHHYLYTLAALPVLSLPNRVSIFGQAFALALFVDGVGRWGWASIIQTASQLVGDANSGTGQPTFDLANSTTQVLNWSPIVPSLVDQGIDSFSALIDDIQFSGNWTNATLDVARLALQSGIQHFFRLAYVANGSSLDFTDPVILNPNGSWMYA